MSPSNTEIEHRYLPATLVATARFPLQRRADLPGILDEMLGHIPRDAIARPPFCILRYVTSVTGGYDAEVGVPVTAPVTEGPVRSRTRPAMEVLALVHTGPLAEISETYRALHGYAADHAIISDEFGQEVYLDWEERTWERTEVHFVVHNWNALLARHLDRVVGTAARQRVMRGAAALALDAQPEARFRWVKGAMARLESLADEPACYDVLSRCAHVFPDEQIAKLRRTYTEALARTDDGLQAVDAVLAFMEQDPGWGAVPTREGHVLYATKKPRDPEAYARAETPAERRRAACFCPLVRDRLDEGMPETFCYCGSGWYRQQWEGALGQPVTISIVKSVLRGDDTCTFTIHLPKTAT